MKVLLIKTSSMGDIIHTLPALTDASLSIPGISFDWVVEEAFAEIPSWHPAVDKIIPVAIRRWRKSIIKTMTSGEWCRFSENLKDRQYDATIDAQGLLKSAFLTKLAKGSSFGFDKSSAKEPLASYFYKHPQNVCKDQHAVERIRQLLAQSLNYQAPIHKGRFSLDEKHFDSSNYANKPYVVFIHSTTRVEKSWPERYWCDLASIINKTGYKVLLPWGNHKEKERAKRISLSSKDAEVLPEMNLSSLAGVLAGANGIVAVDTGLGHLSAALGKPTVSLYSITNPDRIGAYGDAQVHLTSANCTSSSITINTDIFTAMTPELVWNSLREVLLK